MLEVIDRKALDRNHVHHARKIGPHSRPHNFVRLDGRTKEAAFIRQYREDLTRTCGQPSLVQAEIIDQCVWLKLRISMFQRRIAAAQDFTEIDNNVYQQCRNALVKALARLQPAKTPPPRLRHADILAEVVGDER